MNKINFSVTKQAINLKKNRVKDLGLSDSSATTSMVAEIRTKINKKCM
jgi:hypothetical protein